MSNMPFFLHCEDSGHNSADFVNSWSKEDILVICDAPCSIKVEKDLRVRISLPWEAAPCVIAAVYKETSANRC